jgi:hypothetical protein
MKKEKALEVLNSLPKEFEIEELLERIIFMNKVEEGLSQLNDGRVTEHSKVLEVIQKW